MIENPKIGQEVWFAETCNQRIHNAKIIALGEAESKNIHMQILNLRMNAD